ncbi:MAG: hypothetical protein ABL958_06850 [Bdellovibrionia bacterium]
MDPKIKLIAIISVIVALLAGLGYSSYKFLSTHIQEFTDATATSMQDGRALGQGQDQNKCLESLTEKSRECNELTCAVKLGGLLAGCLEVATPSETLCDGVPAGDNKDGYAWADETCRKKNGSITVGCAVLYRSIQERCKQLAPRKKETAKI